MMRQQFLSLRLWRTLSSTLVPSLSPIEPCLCLKTSINVNLLWKVSNRLLHASSTSYAKGKDRQKKDSKGKKVFINENQLREVIDLDKLYEKFEHPMTSMKEEFVNHLTLRTAASALDLLPVVHDGTEYTLQDLAQISKKNPKTFVINVANFPQVIPDILKAIHESGLGLNPQQDGTTLFIPVQKVTKEHRETLAKNAKVMFIKCRDSMREVQNKAIKTIKNQEGISEDIVFASKDQITAIGDKYIAQAETLMKTKQEELTRTEA